MTSVALQFDYRTVDIPMLDGIPQFEVTVHLMGQEGWTPVVLINPTETYPSHSIVFAKELILL